MNIHSAYTDTPYGDRPQVLRGLRELGVRHVRDGLEPDLPGQRAYLEELARHGIRTTFIMGAPSREVVSRLDGELTTFLDATSAALEGPNEYDLAGDPRWAQRLRAYQRRLYRRVQRDARLGARPVLAPSLVGPGSRAELGSLIAAWDVANIHPYPGGGTPEEAIARDLASARPGSKPIAATETGYHNALKARTGQPPTSERATAIYLPRLLLEHFRRGVRRTFLYELVDLRRDPARRRPDENFGLLRSDFRPKPSFLAVRNLLRAVSGPSRGRTTRLRYAVRGAVRHVLLARGDTHYLALWRAVRVWDERLRRDIAPGRVAVTVRLSRAPRSVAVHRPSITPGPTARHERPREIDLGVGGDVVLLQIRAR